MKLVCLTALFPFGVKETSAELETRILCQHFAEVHVLPWHPVGGMALRALPANACVQPLRELAGPYRVGQVAARHAGEVAGVLRDEVVHQPKAWGKLPQLARLALRYAFFADAMERYIRQENLHDAVFYSAWCGHTASVLGLLARRGIIGGFHTRMRGYDLFEFRHPWGWQPFRSLQLGQAVRLHMVSRQALGYLQATHPHYAHKAVVSYRGVEDHGPFPMPEAGTTPHIITCSEVIALKRLPLLVEALKLIDFPLRWTHIGEGPGLHQLIASTKGLPAHIAPTLLGSLTNTEVLNYYRTTPSNAVVNLSTTEGLPISLMEAISGGLPVVATDVGGTRELVHPETGILLPADPNLREIAGAIAAIVQKPYTDATYRQGVRAYFASSYEAHTNLGRFAQSLLTTTIP